MLQLNLEGLKWSLPTGEKHTKSSLWVMVSKTYKPSKQLFVAVQLNITERPV